MSSFKESMASKKFWFSVGAVGILYVFARVASDNSPMVPMYGEFVGGVVGITGAYLLGNLGNKWVLSKAPKKEE